MSGDRFLKRGQLAHPAVRRRPAAQCLGCGDPVPRRRRWCVECATNRDTLAAKKRAQYRATHLCHRCGRPLEPQRGRPPRLCPKCRRKA